MRRSRTTMPRGSGSIRCIGAGCRSRTRRPPAFAGAGLKRTLGAELEAVLGKRPALHVVTIADGARDNWRYLDALAPQGTAMVDFYHAAEHLKSGLDACYGEGDAKGRAQYEKLRHLLRHDCAGVEKVIRSLNHECRKQPQNKRIAEVLGYLRNNRHTAWAMPRRRHRICPLAWS